MHPDKDVLLHEPSVLSQASADRRFTVEHNFPGRRGPCSERWLLALEKQDLTSRSPWGTVTALKAFRETLVPQAHLTRTYHRINRQAVENEQRRWTKAIGISHRLDEEMRMIPHDSSKMEKACDISPAGLWIVTLHGVSYR